MTEPTAMICVGATKAGTSWLYRYLHGHPGCHVRSIKELHFFDTLEKAHVDERLRQFDHVRAGLQARLADPDNSLWTRNNLERRIADYTELSQALGEGDTPRGVALYRAYLAGGRTVEGVVADLTPSYALLPEARLRAMSGLLPAARFVYLLRDPVERLWSHVRMQAVRGLPAGADLAEVALKAQRILNRVVNRGLETHIPARGDYRGAIRRLQAAVPAVRLHFAFFEQLLTGDGLRRLCRFLGLDFLPADVEHKVHAGVGVPLSRAQRNAARHFLADQYAFVEQALGPLPGAWQHDQKAVG